MPASIPESPSTDVPDVGPRGRGLGLLRLRRAVRTPTAVVGAGLTLVVAVVGLLADTVAPSDPFASVGPALASPSREHLMGTDDLGRDVFSGVVYGARTAMLVVAAAVAIAAVLGIAVGAAAGYWGGWVDDLLMRLTELFQATPRFFLAVLVVALFGPGLDNVILVLGFTSWPVLARVVRAETLSLRERDFVEAARSVGASDARILVRHVLPSVIPPAVVVIALMGASVILIEASLSFLGLGDPQVMSWGYLANNAQRFLRVAWWMTLFPGVAIVVAVLGLSLLADAVGDLLNPYAVRARQ